MPTTPLVHPRWLRLTHWLNAVAVVVLVLSGWRVYNASPIFDFRFPAGITIGGWLGGALQWHFAAMWLLVANGLVYLGFNIASGRFTRKFFPLSLKGLFADMRDALRASTNGFHVIEFTPGDSLQRLVVAAGDAEKKATARVLERYGIDDEFQFAAKTAAPVK